MKSIIYIKGVYDTLDLFTDNLITAFESMGYGTFVYHTAQQEVSKVALLDLLVQKAAGRNKSFTELSEEELHQLQGCDLSQEFAVITFNNLGYNLEIPYRAGESSAASLREEAAIENIWEFFNIPYLNILMDHPFHYEKPLRNAPTTSIVLCTDRNHVKYIRRFYKNIRLVDFLPHAGVELHCKHKPMEERGIDVLYAGALPIYTVGRMIPDLSSIQEVDGEDMMQSVLSELVHHPEKTTEQAIEEYVKSKRNDVSEERLQEIIVKMRFVDSYATSFFREQAVRILVESGIQVTTYGTGWDQCDWSSDPHLIYGGKVLAPQILPLMNNSKIVLNTMTWFKAGAHDRIFNGMLAGAAVVTDDSTYLQREFTDGKELVMFSLKDLASLPERVFDLFGHITHMQEIADCGYHAALENHTWKSRAEYLVECYL
ncbi:MAG: glycosyltransferase [Roseburia sp.]